MPWCKAKLKVNLPVLACLGPAAAVASCFMSLEVDLGAEGMGELLSAAAALLTQEVLLPEVLTQVGIVTIVVLGPIRVTEVAEVVVSAQVLEQLVIVQVALVTELTEWMSPMGCIIRVTLHTVSSQVLA